MFASSLFIEGNVYPRKDIADLLDCGEQALWRGVFTPKCFDSIFLFVTENKTPDKTPYNDLLSVDDLEWDGEEQGRSDKRIINHKANGDEILLFYRTHKNAYPGYGFRYEGKFNYVSHKCIRPVHFILKRVHG